MFERPTEPFKNLEDDPKGHWVEEPKCKTRKELLSERLSHEK